MAFIFYREHSRRKTYYVGYYLEHKLVRQKVGKSKALAEKVKGDVEAKMERGDVGLLRKDYPFESFFNEYMQRTKGVHSASYQRRNQTVIDNFQKFLKKRFPHLTKLSQIRPAVIEEYRRFRTTECNGNGDKPVTKRTVNIEVSSIKTFLSRAVKWDLLAYNPIKDVGNLKEDDSKRIRALTEEEVHKLLDAANGWFKPVLIAALYTGLRMGELANLEWNDIDLKRRIIMIRRKPGWHPKSSGRKIRERNVAISEWLADFLREHKKNSRGKDNRVFHNKDGEQLKPGVRKTLMRLTARCGFPDVTQFHALRHTYATHFIEACKDLSVAQQQLGHADIRTTMRYSDVTEDRKRKAAEMLDYGL
jgi:integrase